MRRRDYLKVLAVAAGSVLVAHWVWHRLLAQMEGDPDDQDFDEHCDDEVANMVEEDADDQVAQDDLKGGDVAAEAVKNAEEDRGNEYNEAGRLGCASE